MHAANGGDDAEVLLLECPAYWPGAEEVANAGGDIRLVHAVSAENRDEREGRSGIFVPQFVECILHADQVWQSVQGPFSYAAGAAVSGIIGNYAYDVLKRLFGSYDMGPTPPTPPTTTEPAQRLALLAVRVRCAELGLPAPPFRTLRVIEIRADAGVWTVRVVGGDLLDAEVSLPIEPILEDEPVTVLLRMRLPSAGGRRLE